MNAKDPAHSEDTIREGEESGSPSLFFFLHSRFYLRLCPWMSRDEYTLSNKSLFICGSGQVLRFAWLKIRKANSLPPISFGQYLCHKTFFSKIQLRARGVLFGDVFGGCYLYVMGLICVC